MGFCPERIDHCPRCTLLDIFDAMSPEERATAAGQIAKAELGADPADLETFCFLMIRLVSNSGPPFLSIPSKQP
jgi:hypothetical protein